MPCRLKRVLGSLESMAKSEPGNYATFWKTFGSVLKEGVGEDFANREKVGGLLRFNSTSEGSEGEDVSLADYIARMKEGQEKIYFLLGENLNSARNSAYLEVFKKNGVEVLLLCDRIDEWMISNLREFDGKQLQDISKGELDEALFSDTSQGDSSDKEASTELTGRLKELIGDKVEAVRATRRLTDSPACLVYGDNDIGIQMRQILEASGQKVPVNKPTLEVNLSHPLLQRLETVDAASDSTDLAELLYDQAVLSAGEQLENPAMFVQRLNKLLFTEQQKA